MTLLRWITVGPAALLNAPLQSLQAGLDVQSSDKRPRVIAQANIAQPDGGCQ